MTKSMNTRNRVQRRL